MDRFATCNNADIENLINKSKNSNTTKATSQWMRVYNSWAEARNASLEIWTLKPVDLDLLLQQFYAEVKKNDGNDYEPNSFSAMQAGIERLLKEKNYPVSILKSREFRTSNAVLEGKARHLREQGKGKRPNKAKSLTSAEEEELWNCGQLGSHSPQALVNTIWWQLTQHFGLRGRQEHHSMQVEDFVFQKDDDKNEFLTFAEGVTKTRQSGLKEHQRLVQPKMFETKLARCPIALYRLYLSKRPIHLRSTGPIYLGIIQNPVTNIWYKTSRMGQHTINSIMKRMKENSSLQNSSKRLTNHSARKTLVKKLKKNHLPRSEIIGITGHKRESGLDPYDSGDEVEQRMISHAIDNEKPISSKASDEVVPWEIIKQNCIIPNNDHRLTNPTFSFFNQQVSSSPKPSFNFHNCTVNFYSGNQNNNYENHPKKRRRCVIYSSESSQEN